MFIKSTVALGLFASFVAAQTTANDTINPSTVDSTLRSQWCSGQYNTCGTLCDGATNENTCDPSTLNFTCTCTANSSEPGLQWYTETMPTFICEKIFQNCISDNAGVAAAQALCNANEKANCGHLDPSNYTAAAVTSTSSSASATATAATTSSASVSSSKSTGVAAPTLAAMHNIGSGAIAMGVAAALGYML